MANKIFVIYRANDSRDLIISAKFDLTKYT